MGDDLADALLAQLVAEAHVQQPQRGRGRQQLPHLVMVLLTDAVQYSTAGVTYRGQTDVAVPEYIELLQLAQTAQRCQLPG